MPAIADPMKSEAYERERKTVEEEKTEEKKEEKKNCVFESADDISSEVRKDKPSYSPDIDKWYEKGGTISIDENNIWTYNDWEGNSVSYKNGYPDFKSANLVRQEADIGGFVDRPTDFAKAKALGYEKSIDGTWHHCEDGKTL